MQVYRQPTLREELDTEIEALCRSMLPTLIIPLFILGWGLFFRNVIELGIMGPKDIAVLVLFVTTLLVWRTHKRHYYLACAILMIGVSLMQMAFVALYEVELLAMVGVLGIMVVHALVNTGGSLIMAMMLTLACWGGWYLRGEGIPQDALVTVAVVNALAVAVSWLVVRPIRVATGWALTGWRRANDTLIEARARRGEALRAMRSLEEALFRIERMNAELVSARREAEMARALKARFAATVSHELRGPLNLILGYSRMMALSPERYSQPLPTEYRADLATILRSSEHLAGLVDDILDLSQIEAEKLLLIRDQVDLGRDVIDEAINIVMPLAQRKGLRLAYEPEGDLPLLLADQVRLRQVMLNLLTNAIRFTTSGCITVTSAPINQAVQVTVTDTGAGIEKEELSRLFGEFERINVAAQHDEKGSGLGLAICKRLVQLHGGEIWADSTPGVGTRISFTIPTPGAGALVTAEVYTGESDHVGQEGKRALIVVHDDPDVVRLLARHLEEYSVVGISNGTEIAGLVEMLHPRGVLTAPDALPDLRARLTPRGLDVPLISCELPRAKEKMTGIISYLTKPVAPEVLMALMNRVHCPDDASILLVDDDPDVLRLTEMMLTSIPRAYRIIKAQGGVQALEVLQRIVPDIVFMDLVMPGLSGEETIARMQADDRLADVPIVIVSARDWVEDRAVLGLPITVERAGPLRFSHGIRCLRAVLDAIPPRYLDPAPLPALPPEHLR